MYLKLGKTNIKYNVTQNDYFILSEIVDSNISFETPVFVRSSDELDIWFGNFKSKEYFKELLKSGVTLYLYRPTSDIIDNTAQEGYIDYELFPESENLYSEYDLSLDTIIKDDHLKYRVISSDGEYKDKDTGLLYNYYLYQQNEFIKLNDLPQNINNYSISFDNRDVLRINNNDNIGYIYPKYKNLEEVTPSSNKIYKETDIVNTEKITLGLQTLVFNMYLNDDFFKEDSYILLPNYIDKSNKNILIYSGKSPEIPTKYYDEKIEVRTKSEIINIFKDYEFDIENIDEDNFILYSDKLREVTYFYKSNNFSLDSNILITYDILSNYSKNFGIIEFISKTIGSDEIEDNLINIKIENLNKEYNYRITISRFNYIEVFEGSINPEFGEKRLDEIITSDSKLVYCNLLNKTNKLIEGKWKLRRGYKESYDKNYYWNSLKKIFIESDPVYFDFFLIPDMYDYKGELDKNYNYYKEYETLLEYSKINQCQILIQNSDNGWKYEKVDKDPENPEEGVVYIISGENNNPTYKIYINGELIETFDREILNTYGNNFIFNYIGDKDNRLIYFYKSMLVNQEYRPGYYLYLKGLINNIYSMSVNYIIYDPPVINPYEENNNIEKELEKKKSNYLVNNNIIYYYKKYQNGDTFDTSNWMRFCLGKVYREIEKNKWLLISEKSIKTIENKLNSIVENISLTYSIIRDIKITNFSLTNSTLSLTIDTKMSDLIDNNITIDLDININY